MSKNAKIGASPVQEFLEFGEAPSLMDYDSHVAVSIKSNHPDFLGLRHIKDPEN
jgi:hypothetical protein